MKAAFCLVLCLVALLPAAFSDQQNNENYETILDAPNRRSGGGMDTLLGQSFGTSKRFYPKRNFDEIDAAGFNGFSKRDFDEIDNAGFKDYLRKRNFDEIDAAGFNDFSKRAGLGKTEETLRLNNQGGDVKYAKKNFDEIDAAGFNDFSKRDKGGLHPYGYESHHHDNYRFHPFKTIIDKLHKFFERHFHHPPHHHDQDYDHWQNNYEKHYEPFYEGKYDGFHMDYPPYSTKKNSDYHHVPIIPFIPTISPVIPDKKNPPSDYDLLNYMHYIFKYNKMINSDQYNTPPQDYQTTDPKIQH